MPQKPRSERYKRIMDLLDNALETSPEIGFTHIGRDDRCIRCDAHLDPDSDISWCETCHPKNGEIKPTPPTVLNEDDFRRMSEAVERSVARVEMSLEGDGLHWRSRYPDGQSDGIIQRDGHWRAVLDIDGWMMAGLHGDDLARTWLNQAIGGQIVRLELRQFSTDSRRSITGPGHTITEWGWAFGRPGAPLANLWRWAELDVFSLTARFAAYYAGTPGTYHDGYGALLRRTRWTGATPIAVIEAFFDDPDEYLLP